MEAVDCAVCLLGDLADLFLPGDLGSLYTELRSDVQLEGTEVVPGLCNLTFSSVSKSTLHKGGVGQPQPWEDGRPGFGRSWGGVQPASAAGSLSPCSPAGCVQRPGASAPERLTAHSRPAESQGEGSLVTMPVVGGHRLWPGRVLLPGMGLTSWVGGWAGGAEL